MCAVHVNDTVLFGEWDSNGRGSESSWWAYLIKLIDEFGANRNNARQALCFEEQVDERIFGRYEQLIDYCPNTRNLVHGDFGFPNLLSDGKKITAVIDWQGSKYGDFLYDLAWLDLFRENSGYVELLLKHYRDTGVSVPGFHERVLCYKLHFGLNALMFHSDSCQEHNYNWTKGRLLGLLK